MNIAIDTVSQPLQYDTSTRTFTLYSEDFSLIGTHVYTLQAHLTSYITTATAIKAETSTITIIDPCLVPDDLYDPGSQMALAPYLYTAASPRVEFTMNPFVIFPPTCVVDYSCTL